MATSCGSERLDGGSPAVTHPARESDLPGATLETPGLPAGQPAGGGVSGYSRWLHRLCPAAAPPMLVMAMLLAVLSVSCRTRMPLDHHPPIAEPQSMEELEELLRNSPVPVFAVFVSDGCGACDRALPTLAWICAEYAGRLDVAQVNLDLAGAAILKYDLLSVPTVIIFDGQREVSRRRSVPSTLFLRGFIEHALADVAEKRNARRRR
ncbi:MAG: thioredoxin family protein [Lentisphaeria bacterium]|nr:thioredoxin family protein [Lentisphaeria bacterium]